VGQGSVGHPEFGEGCGDEDVAAVGCFNVVRLDYARDT